ncbi:MAG: hypothetical protein K2J90_11640 [Lachnospiraceae bacterium]|nr:hypothetical protein [Lachnospiraceae bacterium]
MSGITNAVVTGLLGGSDMDITKAFISGYLFGVAAGIGAVLLTAAVTNALLLARFYVITATAGAAMSVGAAIYAIMTNNKKAAIVYGVLAVLSIFNMAETYNYYCQVWLIGEKGIAAFSTADFSVSSNMNEGNSSSTVDMYRAVGVDEYEDIMSNGKLRGTTGTLAAKQFGNDFDETLNWAGKSINNDKVAIIKVTIPKELYNRLNHMELDSWEFPSGTVTVEPEMLEEFNNSIISIEYVY